MTRPASRSWLPAPRGETQWLLWVLFRTALITGAAFLLFGSATVGLGNRVTTYLVQVAVLLLVWIRLGPSLRSPRQRVVIRGIRPRHFLIAVLILPCVVAAGALLLDLGPAFLDWGWWTALGGQGNVIIGQAQPSGQILSDVILPALIVAPLLFSLGRFALLEEQIFRRGDERRGIRDRLLRSLVFGLCHLVMGIPIGAAIALGVGGFGFSQVYLRRWRATRSRHQSVLASARVHLAYNLIIFGVVIVVLLR